MSNELLYYDTLKRIAKGYQTTEQLRRNAQKHYGLPYDEVLEMVYDNLQAEAADAIRGKRRPVERVAKPESEERREP